MINQQEYEKLKRAKANGYEWVARDENGWVYAYKTKPEKYSCGWVDDNIHKTLSRHGSELEVLRWDDEEPCSIVELIEGYESEETEVNKQKLIEKWEMAIESAEFYGKGKEDRLIGYMKDFVSNLKQLDDPEVLLLEENIYMVLDDLKDHIEEQQSLSQNVGMAHTPAGNDTHYRQYDYVLECINEYEPSDDLQNLLVPKQEEVDQAYKAGYETGKQQTFYKGYLEGFTDREKIELKKTADSPEVIQHKEDEDMELCQEDHDPVHRPQHYMQGHIETIDKIKLLLTPEEFLGYLKGNVIKYDRAPFKGNMEQDYDKQKVYYDWALEEMKED